MNAADGHVYAVKSFNNPQGRRTLINEWISNGLFRQCGISVAEQSAISVTGDLLAKLRADPETGRWWANDGSLLHFASRLPVDPDQHAIYDFLPDQLLPRVTNLRDFWGSLVLDTWLGNIDVRQAVCYRGRGKDVPGNLKPHKNRRALIAVMIDHGMSLGGASWDLAHCPPTRPFNWSKVYAGLTGLDDLALWLDAINSITRTDLEQLWLTIPAAWLEGEESAKLDELVDALMRRKTALPRLMSETRESHPALFPDWRPVTLTCGCCGRFNCAEVVQSELSASDFVDTFEPPSRTSSHNVALSIECRGNEE